MDYINSMKGYQKFYQIPDSILEKAASAENKVKDVFKKIDEIKEYNQIKVIDAFRHNRIGEIHFHGSTGYGYNDREETLWKCCMLVFFYGRRTGAPRYHNGNPCHCHRIVRMLKTGDLYCR